MFDIKVKETSLPLSDLLTEKIRVGSSQQTRTTDIPGSRLVDPVDDEDVEEIVQRTDPPTLTSDLKKRKNISTHPI